MAWARRSLAIRARETWSLRSAHRRRVPTPGVAQRGSRRHPRHRACDVREWLRRHPHAPHRSTRRPESAASRRARRRFAGQRAGARAPPGRLGTRGR